MGRVKKQKVVDVEGQQNNGTELTDEEVAVSFEKLQQVQDELEKINEEYSDEVLKVEQKCNEKRKPVYDKRSDVITSIPGFWQTAFSSHPALAVLLTEEDYKVFKYLSKLNVEVSEDIKSGYSITFHFKPNPYFEDSKLTKNFEFLDEGTIKATSTSIKWKEGMGITSGGDVAKKGSKRSHTEESFFTWFNDSEHKGEEDEIQDEVAEIIKDDLWPNPFAYFASDAEKDDLVMCEDGDDDEESDGDGSEGDEDEETEEDDDD